MLSEIASRIQFESTSAIETGCFFSHRQVTKHPTAYLAPTTSHQADTQKAVPSRHARDSARLPQVHEWQIGKRKFKSKMEIDPATPMDVGFYECVADNYHSVDTRGFRTEYTAS